MTFNSGYLLLMPHTLTLEVYSGTDGFGTPHFKSAVSLLGLVVQDVKKISDLRGQVKDSMTQIYLGTTTAIGVRDRLTLPSGFSPAAPSILRVARYSDKDGLHNTVVYM